MPQTDVDKTTDKKFSVEEAESVIDKVMKRDGTIVDFDTDKITSAIFRAMRASEEGSRAEAESVAEDVVRELADIKDRYSTFVPSVEGIQDHVEKALIEADYATTAKSYILYRQERAEKREQEIEVPEPAKKLFAKGSEYFEDNEYGEFIYYRSYSRWMEEKKRRETWTETVQRNIDFMRENLEDKLTKEEYAEIKDAILNQEVMPSMRLMQFSGKPARRTNACAYNCSFLSVERLKDFSEAMYLSMNGVGVGFAVESRNVQKLPQITPQTGRKKDTHVVPDSKEGWCDALLLGMKTWANGEDIDFDYSEIRPRGARLETMGGKASGPDPLEDLLDFTREKMLARQGKRLRNIDAHDIMCKIGEVVVAGGTRRSAMISLSDLEDKEMRDAKKGQFWNNNPQRAMANNSAIYEEKPSTKEFLEEWLALAKSGSGERGIFNRGNVMEQIPERRSAQFKDSGEPDWGTNPCGEIILQSHEFCNLSEVICRPDDSVEDLMRKVRLASIIGTYQSTLTHFPYLSDRWEEKCNEERLLGVSLTGQWDCPTVRDEEVYNKLREEAVRVNKKYAKRFDVTQSKAVTTIKPSGTVSQTFDTAAGMHPRHSEYYIRRVRISASDALFQMMKEQGVPYKPEKGQTEDDASTYVLEFPLKAPDEALVKDDLTAIDQLEHWKMVKTNYTEHNPSVTISVGEDEWIEVANWVYENWEIVGGLSFLPRTDHVYDLAPYEAINEEEYEELKEDMPEIDFSQMILHELEDETDLKKQLACVAGGCEGL